MPNQQKTAKDSLEKAIGRTRYFLMIKYILPNQSKRQNGVKLRYGNNALTSPIQAPFSHCGFLFDTNSVKKDLLV